MPPLISFGLKAFNGKAFTPCHVSQLKKKMIIRVDLYTKISLQSRACHLC